MIAKVSTRRETAALAALGVPVVNISGQIATPRQPTVNSDDLLVGRMALRHLHGKGYRRFAYCGSAEHLASHLRWLGFRQEAATLGIAVVERKIVPRGDHSEPYPDRLRTRLAQWVADLPKPVGIFAFTDRVALELDEACHRSGRRVPEEVAILGVGNDLTRLEFAHVEISSIQLNTRRIGLLAAELLHDILGGRLRPPRSTLVSPLKIVTRRSTDRFSVDDEVVAHALDYLREHEGNVIYVDEVARVVGVSRRVLEMRFRRHLNTSVYAEAQRMHLDHAIELMADPDLTISEIAYASGFESASRFSTAFRGRFGQPPARYRAGLRA